MIFTLIIVWTSTSQMDFERADGHEYHQVPLQGGLIHHDITYDIAITVAGGESDIRITTDTPYMALTGELWSVYREDFGENWPRYNGTALYK